MVDQFELAALQITIVLALSSVSMHGSIQMTLASFGTLSKRFRRCTESLKNLAYVTFLFRPQAGNRFKLPCKLRVVFEMLHVAPWSRLCPEQARYRSLGVEC